MKDDDLMPFGKHKGKAMANVPASWLVWFWESNETAYKGGVMLGVEAQMVMGYLKETGIDWLRKEAKNDR